MAEEIRPTVSDSRGKDGTMILLSGLCDFLTIDLPNEPALAMALGLGLGIVATIALFVAKEIWLY